MVFGKAPSARLSDSLTHVLIDFTHVWAPNVLEPGPFCIFVFHSPQRHLFTRFALDRRENRVDRARGSGEDHGGGGAW